MRIRDLTGHVYGRLHVLGLSEKRAQNGGVYFYCVCVCGHTKEIPGSSLTQGFTTSCGCLHSELLAKRNYIDGASHHALYPILMDILSRCYVPTHPQYDAFGGRGIDVYGPWRIDRVAAINALQMLPGWDQRLLDLGTANLGMSLQRYDTNSHFTPSNLYWSKQLHTRINSPSIGGVIPIEETAIEEKKLFERRWRVAARKVPVRREINV